MIETVNEFNLIKKDLFEHYSFIADPNQNFIRVDKFLMDRIPNTTRSKLQTAIDEEYIKVNGNGVKASYKVKPNDIYNSLPKILDAVDNGSVITRDYAMNILITLASISQYSESAFSLLTEQLLTSPTNQLPMYAERILPIINEQNKNDFVEALKSRLNDIEKESKRKRVEKVIKKLVG